MFRFIAVGSFEIGNSDDEDNNHYSSAEEITENGDYDDAVGDSQVVALKKITGSKGI